MNFAELKRSHMLNRYNEKVNSLPSFGESTSRHKSTLGTKRMQQKEVKSLLKSDLITWLMATAAGGACGSQSLISGKLSEPDTLEITYLVNRF